MRVEKKATVISLNTDNEVPAYSRAETRKRKLKTYIGQPCKVHPEHPEKMRLRRETVELPFGTIKSSMGATYFQMKTLKKVHTEMALHVLAYNLRRVMNILGPS